MNAALGAAVFFPWSAGESDEGVSAFRFLGGQELIRSSALAVNRVWCRLRFSAALWKEFCSTDFPHMAAAFEENPSWAPQAGTFDGLHPRCCDWYYCYRRLARIPAALGKELLMLECPGCGRDMVPDLIKLFSQLLLFGENRADGEPEVRAALPMFATAAGIAEIYSQDAQSALPDTLFRSIVDNTCQEYVEARSTEEGLHCQPRDSAMDCENALDYEVVLRCEDFIELFAELLLGDAFQNSGAALVRSLRPWSTALTHNLIRRLCDPGDPCTCMAGEPPNFSVLQPN